MRNLDHAYDQYLSGREKEMVRAIERFEQRMQGTHVKFGRFTIPTFFKPHFVTPRQERLVKDLNESIVAILNKVIQIYFDHPELEGLFHLSEEGKQLVAIDPGYAQNIVVARLDCLMEGESVKYVELNTDSPAGMAYADVLEDILRDTEELKEFLTSHHLKHESRSEKLLQALLKTYEEFGGSNQKPQIAIVDWRTVRTRPEFEALKVYFEGKGYPTVIADPRDLRYKGGKLYYDEFRIDLLYRRVIFNELLEKLDEVGDFIKAYRDKAVCVVNSLRSRIAGSKGVLSILTNPGFDTFFTEEENKVKKNHIAWTRRMVDAEKFYGGKKIYLIDFLKDEKETLVLKPSEGYGGKDVFIGCETREEDWNRAIDRALKSDWVIQEFISIPIMTVPVVVNNRLDFLYKKINFNPFTFGGKYAGSFARLSDESVINVARNGGLITSIAMEEIHER